jgi:hypothetical protein
VDARSRSRWQRLVAEDVELGDPAFDRAFVVRGDPSSLANLLDESARRALLGLHEFEASIRIDQRSIDLELERVVGTRLELTRILDSLSTAAGALLQITPRPTSGPYR